MQTCKICLQLKDSCEFARKGLSRFRSDCRDCYNQKRRNAYEQNSKIKNGYKSRNEQRRWDFHRQITNYLLQHPCVDCGETNILTLEFDHVELKNHTIGQMVKKTWEVIWNEIEKCQVRCASCHRIKTHERSNSVRFQIAQSL